MLSKVMAGGHLSTDEAAAAMEDVLSGGASPPQLAAFVAALRVRGETAEEMAGFVRAMLAFAVPLDVGPEVVDTCGTGGDRSRTINVSTISAFVVAGAGARVCKHGGRAASSAVGSADVLEALGVVIDLGPQGVARCIDEAGIGFCFAPRFHSAMRHAAAVRKDLGAPTVFNFLGPLANPARAAYQVVGVSDPLMAPKMAEVLSRNHTRHSMVVYGHDGLDELSLSAPSTVIEVRSGPGGEAVTETYEVKGEEVGLRSWSVEDIRGGGPADNAAAARRVLEGEGGAALDVVLLNSAAALVVAGKSPDLASGVGLAAESVTSGRALAALGKLVEVSRREGASHEVPGG
ncbi:MAG: anthranilate phosphoribosyltransferase [Acidimicrobiales bacterium]